ncbi:hypothetical protein M408DRAFT_332874 [Serendipita vermifera MAFF 305830]|uniref:Rab-GAP TBC domain-containing protein n=1 Tax=Serendipita vermifera MAFF 305830 TaxID=933852 RepID=A0A0C2W831_SERVB|nr:hypothetical protein M408DRAFT_332874 [Serendipita vermifera MAFF 305830]
MSVVKEESPATVTLPDDTKTISEGYSTSEKVKKAVSAGDWDALRALSLSPGGFGDARMEAWQFLLNAKPGSRNGDKSKEGYREQQYSRSDPDENLEPHPDERQVGLDTDRSFVVYPGEGDSLLKSKDDLKTQLHHVIVHVLRKRPKLAYFQGYHDVLSVLVLTFNEQAAGKPAEEMTEALNLAAEKLSLHRLRDSMGPGLEPLVGLLRLVKQLIRADDPEYAKQLSTNSPLPYFALSNLLTYFSHDVPTLPLIQHIFDYLLSRPPISIVYLVTVMLLVRKDEVQGLYQSGDEGMLHALLCNLPELVDNLPPEKAAPSPTEPSQAPLSDTSPLSKSWDEPKSAATEDLTASHAWTSVSATASVTSQSWTAVASSASTDSIPSPGASPTLAPVPLNPSAEPPKLDVNVDSTLEFPPLDTASPLSHTDSYADEKGAMGTSMASSVFVEPVSRPSRKQPLSLIALLQKADALYTRHPMSAIQTASIMGPQSVVFTWTETGKPPSIEVKDEKPTIIDVPGVHWETAGSDQISDDMAEKMVLRPELVVRPWRDEDEEEAEKEAEAARAERQRRQEIKKAKGRRAEPGVFGAIAGNKGNVIVVGGMVFVVALGVVIAVYGKNGEWKRWIGKSSWLPKSSPAGGF